MTRIARVVSMILILGAACIAPTSAASDGLTVGEFLRSVAMARNLPAADGQEAARMLRLDGVALPSLDLTATIKERTVVAISASLGIQVTTSRPDAAFDAGSMGAYLELLPATEPATQRSSGTGEPGPYPRPNGNAADPRTKGKGKKKGLPPVSESGPV